MAQFDYFATWNDDWVVLPELLSEVPLSIVLDKWYSDKTLVAYKEMNADLQARLVERRRFYLVPDGVSLNTDAGLAQHKSGSKIGWYRIRANLLGVETLDLSLPGCYEEDGMTCLGSGILTYAKEYLNHGSGIWQRPSKSLIALYKRVRGILQRNLKLVPVNRSQAWVGPEAKQLLDSGRAKIIDRGL